MFRWILWARRSALAALFVTPLTLSAAEPSSIGVDAFFRNPDLSAAKLSPSGKWLAVAMSNTKSRVFLAVVNLDGTTMKPVVVANFNNADIRSFDWVNDERLVFNTIDTQAPANDQRFGPGLYAVRRDGGEMRVLIRSEFTPTISEGNTRIASNQLEPDHELLTTLADGGDDVIVGQYRYTPTGELDSITPKRLNTTTGRASSLAHGAPDHVQGWLFDGSGSPRVAESLSGGMVDVAWRPAADKPWTSIARYPRTEIDVDPVGLDSAGQLYVLASSKGYAALRRFDFTTGKPEPEAILATPGFDLSPRLHLSRKTGRLLGVSYETDAGGTVWFDPDFRKLQATIDARLPGRVNTVVCRVCRDDIVLIDSSSDQDPGTFYLYTVATDTWMTVGKQRDNIVPARMAQTDFHRTKARDGEDLPIWVTTPAAKAEKPRPAVVLVHGGPWVRGRTWQWDDEAQFLASRGYVVLEPEFRGSTGYGRQHHVKGFRQWGLAMENDLVDTVRWAADKGLVDKGRVCLMGASYGGYATLMGLVRDPDTFKCGVAWLAVTDVRLMFDNSWQNDIPREAQLYSLPTMIGDPVKDAELLRDASPVEHAKDIRSPLLMAFGGNDLRVPLNHGTLMRDALRSAGQKPEFVIYDGEGHGFLKLENRVDFYTRVEKFLAANLQ